ncbi:MAG: phasin family protein [Thermoanaerobaculia bacterium]
MSDSLLDQLKARGEAFFTEISNNLMSNPTFIDMLKKGIAAKEAVDKQVAEALPRMNVATRKDVSKLEDRIDELESELQALRSAAAAPKRAAPTRPRAAAPKPAATKAPARKAAPQKTAPSRRR